MSVNAELLRIKPILRNVAKLNIEKFQLPTKGEHTLSCCYTEICDNLPDFKKLFTQEEYEVMAKEVGMTFCEGMCKDAKKLSKELATPELVNSVNQKNMTFEEFYMGFASNPLGKILFPDIDPSDPDVKERVKMIAAEFGLKFAEPKKVTEPEKVVNEEQDRESIQDTRLHNLEIKLDQYAKNVAELIQLVKKLTDFVEQQKETIKQLAGDNGLFVQRLASSREELAKALGRLDKLELLKTGYGG
jgi:hypothetical protein